ncbi:MAG: zinc dependent phospholipase C family protein [Lachnospiraceae bacterium]|nr:zinc dependent phospholipase C family protein [Lachnospiraceae bacterium]
MSYPMVHLKVAYGLLLRFSDGYIERKGDFLLGSVAPDAVHFHETYDVSLKEKSHVWKYGPCWGVTMDSEGWRNAIRKFWEENKDSANRDFLAGYCTHLLTDWENDRRIWAPFREKMEQGAKRDEVYGEYGKEAKGMDLWLYQNDKETQEIWQLLEQGKACGVKGCIQEEDLARQKQFLLYEEFIGKDTVDVSRYRFCTRKIMAEFIKVCEEKIFGELFT